MSADDRDGRITMPRVVAPGAFAGLLVIDGNPLEDIRLLTTPARPSGPS
jgi:hypothetical protein